jgi:hypothetical protein
MYNIPQQPKKEYPGKAGVEKILRAFDENPLAVITVAAMAMTAVAKLIDAVGGVQSRRAYAKQVNLKKSR